MAEYHDIVTAETKMNLPFELGRLHNQILFVTLAYYNALLMELDKNYRLGATRPPSVYEFTGHKTDSIDAVVAEFREHDIVHEPRAICRVEVDYCPTRRGRYLIDDLFADVWTDEYWHPADRDEYDIEPDSVLLGEQNEGLVHRFGVEAAFRSVSEQYERRVRYPQPAGAQPDVHLTLADGTEVGVEVITGHNDYEQIVDKYMVFASRDRPTIWLFPRAELAARICSLLERRAGFFRMENAPFENPSNYRRNRLQEYHNRSRTSTSGMAHLETYEGLLNRKITPYMLED